MQKGAKTIFFLIFLIFGAYFINYPFNFVKLPVIPAEMISWVIFLGGILIIIGGISFLKATKFSA